MAKETLRKQFKRERVQVPKASRQLWDRCIFEHLKSWPHYQEAKTVMTYLAFGWEIDTWNIVRDLKERGKDVYVPVVQKEPKGLLATQFTSREQLVPAVFGILEPRPGTPTVSPLALDLVIVPGVVFSRDGYRIGYGGGYYDRFLTTTKATTVGLVYQAFLREFEPDTWDQAVDFLMTEEGLLGRK